MATAHVDQSITDRSPLSRARAWIAGSLSSDGGVREGSNIVGLALVITALAVIVVQPVAWITLGHSRSTRWDIAILGVLFVFTAAPLVVLGLSYFRVRADPENRRWYHAGVAVSAGAVAAFIVAASATTVVLTRHAPHGLSLATVELDYVWHALDAIPFLQIPETLGWSEPGGMGSHPAGGLLIVFELAVMLPVVHLLLRTYSNAEARHQTRMRTMSPKELLPDGSTRAIVGVAALLIVVFIIVALAVFSPDSWLNRLVSSRFPGHVDFKMWWVASPQIEPWMILAAGTAVAVAWVFDAGSIRSDHELRGPAIAATALFAVGVSLSTFEASLVRAIDSRAGGHLKIEPVTIQLAWGRTALEGVFLCVVLVFIAVLVAACLYAGNAELGAGLGVCLGLAIFFFVTASYVMLADLGAGGGVPGDRILAAAELGAWEVADMVPGVAVPDTLGWVPAYHPAGWSFGVLSLLLRAGTVLVVAFPVMRFVQYLIETRRPRASGSMTGLARLDDLFARSNTTFAALDRTPATQPIDPGLVPPRVTDEIRKDACTVETVLGHEVGALAISSINAVNAFADAVGRDAHATARRDGDIRLSSYVPHAPEDPAQLRSASLEAGRAMGAETADYGAAVARALDAQARKARAITHAAQASPQPA